ncbi:hypothetical protein ACRAWF_16535 [Streptomyces sp. L7]
MADPDASLSGNELGDFLRARRAERDPHEAGFPTTADCAAYPGLRRRNSPISRT